MKIPVIGDDSFTLILRTYEGVMYVHCDIHKWVKSTKKENGSWFRLFVKEINNLFMHHMTDTDKTHRKFLDMYGFKYFGKVKDFDGDRRTVYVKRGKR
jgi:hypothetical protein